MGWASAAVAQTQTAPNAGSAKPEQLSEVIVTAQKRSERIQDVPISMTAVNASTLVQENLVSLSDLYTRIPGLNYAGTDVWDISIRGISTGGGTNPTVAILIDDVPYGSSSVNGQSQAPDLDPAAISQIDVLRGPQGTLYGANSLGGLIKYVTLDPDTHAVSGRMEVDGSAVDHGAAGYAVRLFGNTPIISDKLALSISGFYRLDPQYTYNTLVSKPNAYDNAVYGGRIAMIWKPIDRLTVNLSALLQNNKTIDSPTEDLQQNYSPITGDLQHSSEPEESYDQDQLYVARVKYSIGWANIISITSYGDSRADSIQDLTTIFGGLLPILDEVDPGLNVSPASRVIIDNFNSTNKFTQEVRLASQASEKIEWLTGIFYTHEQTSLNQGLNTIGATAANIYTGLGPSKYEEIAAFADLTYHFTSKFDLQIGGRLARNNQFLGGADSGALNILETGSLTSANITSKSAENAPTWLIAPRYHFTSDLMAYLRIATGYRPGGPNTILPSIPATFASDTTINYEAGVKGGLLGRRLLFDADIYWIDWNRIQLDETDPVSQFSFFANAGHARSRGMEGSVEYRPWTGANIAANVAITDAVLTTALPSGPSADAYAPAGARLPYSAKLTSNLSAAQSFQINPNLSAFVGGNVSYVGERYGSFASDATTSRLSLPAYTQLDLRTGVQYQTLTMTLFIRNLTDERGFLAGTFRTRGVAADGYTVTVIQPRTIGMSLAKAF